jgi:hypothetical protein
VAGTVADNFPAGTAALHPDWPEGRFNVSGMFVYHPVVLGLFGVVETGFRCRVPIEAIHGAPAVIWNAGRIEQSPFKVAELYGTLSALYARNVGCFPTFTNHLLEPNDLADSTCNYILECVALRPDLNGVIVAGDLLSKYIADKFPDLRQVASITKVALEGGRGNASYYQELGKRFYRYIVHPDDCHDPKLLDQLDRDKAEIIVNENCLRECTLRARHYELIAKAQKAKEHDWSGTAGAPAQAPVGPHPAKSAAQELEEAMAECPSMPLNRQINRRRRNCNFTRQEMKAVYDMGFRHFKLQGRRDGVYCYAYDLTRYLLEPDFAAPLVFKTLCPMITFTPGPWSPFTAAR